MNDRSGVTEHPHPLGPAGAVPRCFAIAAFVMLPMYDQFALGRQSELNYFRPSPFTLMLPAVWLGTLTALGVSFSAIAVAVQRLASARVQRVLFAASPLLLIPSAQMLLTEDPNARWAFIALLAATSAACAVSATALRAASSLLLILSFIVPVQIATVAWDYVSQASPERFIALPRPSRVQSNRAVADAGSSRHPDRVLCLVFDELDDELTFALRPADVQLPAIDALRSEAVYVSGAKSATGFTVSSMPSMLLGKRLKNAHKVDADTLRMTSDGSKPFTWQGQQNVFSDAKAAGLRTAMVGWYHPYCRVLGPEVDYCEQYLPVDAHEALRYESTFQQLGFWESIRKSLHTRVGSTPIARIFGVSPAPSGENIFRPHRASIHTAIAASAAKLAADSSIGLTFIHLNIPHHPGIYDRVANRITWRGSSNYFDNLELVDVTVAVIRSAMVAAGLWDATTVILTSDHPLRDEVWRTVKNQWTQEEELLTSRRKRKAIPFIMKLAGQREGVTIDSHFETVRIRGLLKAVRNGEISTDTDAVAWINGN